MRARAIPSRSATMIVFHAQKSQRASVHPLWPLGGNLPKVAVKVHRGLWTKIAQNLSSAEGKGVGPFKSIARIRGSQLNREQSPMLRLFPPLIGYEKIGQNSLFSGVRKSPNRGSHGPRLLGVGAGFSHRRPERASHCAYARRDNGVAIELRCCVSLPELPKHRARQRRSSCAFYDNWKPSGARSLSRSRVSVGRQDTLLLRGDCLMLNHHR